MGDSVSTHACAHLHVHSEYSLLDGAANIEALAARAAAFGQPALGLTDHGVMNGSVELYKACKKHGVKPILGLEAYFVDDRTIHEEKVERNHLTLLAASDEGFRNLVKLSSAGFLEGLNRGKPGVDLDCLARHAEGVIALSGCLASRSSRRIVEGRLPRRAPTSTTSCRSSAPRTSTSRSSATASPSRSRSTTEIAKFAQEMGRPLVATADVHYLRKEDYHHHAALLCVQTKSTLAQPKMSFDTNEFYLKSSEEMAESFADMPEALASTLEIAERCDTTIALKQQLIPRFDTPNGESEEDYLRTLVDQGLRKRYGDPIPAAARERADLELAVIGNMGFNAYFLIVWDFVAYAKANGIAVGPGRGSAAGSIVSYSLEITDVDPLRYDLLFERFLNAERVSMPDIDIDFSVRGRDRVIRYVTDKYGERPRRPDHHLRPHVPARRHARRRARARPRLRRRRPPRQADPRPDHGPPAELRGLPAARRGARPPRSRKDPTAKQIVDVARGLEGIVRNASIHAAAVVISDRPLTDIVPLQLADAGVGEDGEEDLPHRHPVLDEADRGDRAAEDGLPGPAQPRRDRGRADHHRALERQPHRHGDAAARRREDLRDDGPRRRGGRVPVRVRGHARGAQEGPAGPSSRTSSRSTRSTARAPWTRSRPTPAASATPTRSPTSTTACARSPRRRRA